MGQEQLVQGASLANAPKGHYPQHTIDVAKDIAGMESSLDTPLAKIDKSDRPFAQ